MADAVETDPITGSIEPGRTNDPDRCTSVADNYSALTDEELARLTKGIKSAFQFFVLSSLILTVDIIKQEEG